MTQYVRLSDIQKLPVVDIDDTTPPNPEGGDYSHLIDNGEIYPTPDMPLPGYLEPFKDPVFGTTVTRITGDSSPFGQVNKPFYMNIPAWNADSSMICLQKPALLLNGDTYALLQPSSGVPSGGEYRWHPDEPALMYYAAGDKIGIWNPKIGAKETVKAFSGYSGLAFTGKGKLSDNGEMVCLKGTKSGEKCFAFNIKTGEKGPDIPLSDDWSGLRISASGKYIIIAYDDEHDDVLSLDGDMVLKLTPDRLSHYDVMIDAGGNEIMVGRARSGGSYTPGEVYAIELPSGNQRKIQKRTGYQNHSSATNGHEWTLNSMENASGKIYRDELVLMKNDGSENRRVCHTHTAPPYSYDYEPQAVFSRDGKRALWHGGWHTSTGAVHTYCVELTG